MPREVKKTDRKTTGNPRPRSKHPIRITRSLPYIIISVVVAAALVLVGVAYFQQYVAPFNKVVMTFDGESTIQMRYFLQRAKLAGASGLSTLQNLTNEEILKMSEEKYDITVTDQDVTDELRNRATGSDNTTITDAEFREWYRQLLNESRVSDSLYREMVAASVREARFREYVYASIPSVVEHAHVYAIFQSTYDEALAVKERIEAGENFYDLARELSIDQTTAENGGELDWIPKGAWVFNMDPFSLEVGQVSDVLAVVQDLSAEPTEPSAYYVMMVKEIADREIVPDYLSDVQTRTYQDWLTNETKTHDVDWNYNSEIDAWVGWQLSKS